MTSRVTIINARLAPGEGLGSIAIEDGRIASIGEAQPLTTEIIDAEGAWAVPGFVDIHCHGAAGVDVNWATTEELLIAAEFLARNGVAAWLPTLVPDSDENYRSAIDAIDRLMELQEGRAVAQAIGVHYEGVFANEAMCGALRPQHFKRFTGSEVRDLPRLKRGIHMTTLAPEIEGGIDLIRELKSDGWVVAIGHTRASADVLDAALEAGATHVTHFFNAMTGIHHRELGVAGWGMTEAGVTFDIIADGIHVHPRMLEFACLAKGVTNVSLISDSIAPTGLGDGVFTLWGEQIAVADGRTQNARGSIAGSVITMADAVERTVSIGISVPDGAGMASQNPAVVVGVGDKFGEIDIGRRADVCIIDDAGKLKLTLIAGRRAGEK